MKSYLSYILSKFVSSICNYNEIIFVSDYIRAKMSLKPYNKIKKFKLKHIKAHKSILSRRFGDLTGEQEISIVFWRVN